MAEVTCRSCGTANAATQRFCGSCGQLLEQRCPACGTANPSGFRFCGSCGGALSADAPPPPAAPVGEAERRYATVLFADLSGFTSLSERLDPEEVTGVIDRCMGLMGDIVTRYGGTISRVIGDELMALFGAPLAHEDDPERAVRAALELLVCAADHTAEFRGMPLRIGVNTGETLFGPVGPNRESTVMGDAVNVAKRLQTAMSPGNVVVGEDTYRATRHAIRYEQLPAVEAKGKAEPVLAWRAVAAEAQAMRPVSAAPMVGRAAELDLLRQVWTRIETERRPHLATVIGPPGIGKTRVTTEITTALEGLGVQVVRGRSLPYGESTGFGAFAQQVKNLAGIMETDPAPTALAKLRGMAAALLDDTSDGLTQILPTLAGLASEAAAERAVVFMGARRFVEAVARNRPTVFVFEDVHWADGTLLDLIEMLASRTHDAPAMFLTLARPELLDRRANWGGGLASYTSLRLEPLPLADATRLVRHLLEGIPGDLLDRIVEVAGGNPLFLEELAAAVSEQTSELARELPTSVTGIIASRLDTLPPLERRVLLDASVVGKVFWRGALEQMGQDARLDQILDALEAKDLIRMEPSSRLVGDTEYLFKHMLIREVAYQTLPRAARRDRHRAVAQFIEKAAGDRLGESASLLAHHWLEADDTARAVEYLLIAARHAGGAWAKEEAIGLFTRALELLPEDDPQRINIRFQRGRERVALGDFEGAIADLDPILEQLDARDRIEALIERSRAAFWLFRTDEGIELSERAATEAEALGATELRSAALGTLATHVAGKAGGLSEADGLAEQALVDWPVGFMEPYRATMINHLGLFAYWRGDHDRAIEHAGRGHELAVRIQAFEGVVNGGANYALSLAGAGRVEEALALFETVIKQGTEYGAYTRFIARAHNMLAGTLRDLFDIDGALEHNAAAVDLAAPVGFAVAEAQGGIDFANIDLLLGEVGAVERRLPELHELGEKAKGSHAWLVAGRLLDLIARLTLITGESQEAAEAAERALQSAIENGRGKYEASARTTLARALLGMKEMEAAEQQARLAVAGAEKVKHPKTLWQVLDVLAAVLAATGREQEAADALARAAGVITSFADGLAEQRRARFLGDPSVRELVGGSG